MNKSYRIYRTDDNFFYGRFKSLENAVDYKNYLIESEEEDFDIEEENWLTGIDGECIDDDDDWEIDYLN